MVDRAGARTAAEYELIDLADWPLPHMDEPLPPSMGQYQGEHTRAWAAELAEFDGYVVVQGVGGPREEGVRARLLSHPNGSPARRAPGEATG